MNRNIDTGYEGGEPDVEARVVFRLHLYPQLWASDTSVYGSVTRNGVSIGMIRFASLEELNEMKKRLDFIIERNKP